MLKRKNIYFILMLLSLMFGKNCFANELPNPFKGTWVSEAGTVEIKNCTGSKCEINIETYNGAYSCNLDGTLTALSNTAAVFFISDENDALNFPVDLSLSKHVIKVSVPGKSREVARNYCGARGYFEDEYTDKNYPEIYEASFNCDKAKTKIEHAICQSPELAHQDRELSKLYFKLKKKKFKNIVDNQREWIKNRNGCARSSELSTCLSDKFNDRILSLQQDFMASIFGVSAANKNLPFNADYLFYMSKKSAIDRWEITADPPLHHYLNSILKNENAKEELSLNYQIDLNPEVSDSVLMITGVVPGVAENALVLKKDHNLWFAYTSYNTNNKRQLIILCQKNAIGAEMPDPLKEWVERVLSETDNKEIVYKKVFS